MAATPEKYRKTLEELLDWQGCDAVLRRSLLGAVSSEFAVEPILGAKQSDKPLARSSRRTPSARSPCSPSAASPASAPRGLRRCLRRVLQLACATRLSKSPSRETELGRLSTCGVSRIPVVEQQVARAPEFQHSVPYPVVVKVAGVEHKTEVGGIALDVPDRKMFLEKTKNQSQVLVQRMEKGLAEAIVGYRNDPVVGPLVLVGAGGTLAELYDDVALALAPVSEDEALAMIARVKGLSVLTAIATCRAAT